MRSHTESPECNICKSRETSFLFQGRDKSLYTHDHTFPVVRCRGCGLVFLSPQPSNEERSYHYYEYPCRSGREAQMMGHYQPVVDAMMRMPPGRVLDIGTGNSPFLPTMEGLGWDVSGTEVDGVLIEEFHREHHIDLFGGDLQDAGFETGSFDVITIMGVLEHVSDPYSLMQEASRILKNGGLLCLYCFNRGLEARLLGRFWVGFDVPRHLYSFSYLALEKLLTVNSFHIEACTYHPVSFFPYFVSWAGMRAKNRLTRSGKPTFPPLNLPRAVDRLNVPVGKLLASLRASSSIFVFARNNGGV